MPWNDSTKVLTSPFTKIAANGQGDLQKALSSSLMSQIRLFTETNINPMAKYKPFRDSTVLFATDAARNAARANARYGFGGIPPQLVLSQTDPKNNWVYLRPRGGAYNEPLRALDFVKSAENSQTGYAKNACSPIALSVGQLVYDAQSQILFFAEGMSNAIREDGLYWAADQSLSLDELLKKPSDFYSYYIAFVLIDTSDSNRPKNLIVTNTTVNAFVTTEHNQKQFYLYPTQTTESGIIYPAVPLLTSTRRNDVFEIIACIIPGNNPQSGYAYAVYSDSTTPTVSSLTAYSLGFTDGSDRVYRKLDTGEFKMDGLVITSVNVACQDTLIEMAWNGYTWRAYAVEVRAILDTSRVAYSGMEKTVSGTIVLSNNGGFGFGPSPSEVVAPLSRGAAVSLVGGTAGQDKPIMYTGADDYLWVMKYNGAPLPTTVTATLTFDYPLTEPKSESGTATTS